MEFHEPGAQGPKSTQLTLQSHSSESTRGSLGSQRSPYSSPLSLSLMPNLAHLHGCSHSCDALPCFSPGSITPWLSATPSPGSSQATHPKAMPTPPTCSPAPVPRSWLARARSLTAAVVIQSWSSHPGQPSPGRPSPGSAALGRWGSRKWATDHHSSRFHFCSGLCSSAFSGLTLNLMPPPPPHSFAAPAMVPNNRKVKTAFSARAAELQLCAQAR